MSRPNRSTGMLASVTSLREAALALQWGADIIDLKNPSEGALGALPLAAVSAIVKFVAGRKPVSATVGDLTAMEPMALRQAVTSMAATGVDYVKAGFFPGRNLTACVEALSRPARDGAAIVAVLFADSGVKHGLLGELALHGFTGVMLDTAVKDGRSLRDHLRIEEIRAFVQEAKARGLLTGLAGSLSEKDIPHLLPLRPDYLGFRGGLCRGGQREQQLDQAAFDGVRDAVLQVYQPVLSDHCG